MYWISQLLALTVTGALGTHALEASILKFPSQPHVNGVPATVSEDFARAVLDLRLKPSLASVLGGIEADIADHLNQFSDTQSTLFGGSGGVEASRKSLLVFEGLDNDVGSSIRKMQPGNLFVPNTSYDLVDNLVGSLKDAVQGETCTYERANFKQDTDGIQSLRVCLSKDPLLVGENNLLNSNILASVQSAEVWVEHDNMKTVSIISFAPDTNDNGALTGQPFKTALESLVESSTANHHDATAIILTASQNDLRGFNRVSARDEKSSERSSPSYQFAAARAQRSAQGLPLHSNLAPVCHVSNSSCAEATNNCSGHGYCGLKYASVDETTSGNCYICRCQQTEVRNSDGTTQKIQWGGPACEKKDISSPFFLIAGASVFVVALISSAIGLLFSMGQQDLPGIISAGVAGSKPSA
ncbi:hypothetical protein N7468_001937 [Penicillium chermesinum]|uniref:Vacuolar sorting protein Vps3844 C-terminal domain-containing protein n=1 Tax=Penicillium chermesinum TaxID=63820 RepID=A0A9W9TZ39_9EURO|nr:uncharacterized protein N7468_001937 [Penicillium chermesinum]KAJ5246954.1 hypothetical protein N7468_001937 [Penicillium chermesinum]KAJ6145206.1 hypothetical protein N7470_009101 [Penicillium chermesinum]